MSKHTPGPWEVSDTVHIDGNGEYRRIQQPHFGGDIIGLVCVKHKANEDLNKAGRANARLISAAPDLLEALSGVLKIERGTSGRIILEGWHEEVIRAVIAKATGERT